MLLYFLKSYGKKIKQMKCKVKKYMITYCDFPLFFEEIQNEKVLLLNIYCERYVKMLLENVTGFCDSTVPKQIQ